VPFSLRESSGELGYFISSSSVPLFLASGRRRPADGVAISGRIPRLQEADEGIDTVRVVTHKFGLSWQTGSRVAVLVAIRK